MGSAQAGAAAGSDAASNAGTGGVAGVPAAAPVPASEQEAKADMIAHGELTWEPAAPCPMPRFEASGVVIGGELWVLGGFITGALDVTRSVHIYDPETDSWREGPSLEGAETHFGVVLDDGDLLLIGGSNKAQNKPTSDEVWRLPAGETAWRAEPPLPSARAAVFAVALGDTLHVTGGLASDNTTDQAEHLSRAIGGGPWMQAPKLPDARNHGGGVVSGGLFYAVAGRHGWDHDTGQSAAVHVFDPESGEWSERASLPTGRSEIGASTVTTEDGRIIALAGSTAGVKPSANVFEYTPSSDSWRALPPLPQPRKGAVAARIGRRIIVTTGSPSGTEPAAETWLGCCVD